MMSARLRMHCPMVLAPVVAVTLTVAVLTTSAGVARSATEIAVPDWVNNLVNAPDRDAADRARDTTRRPAQTLSFAGIKPGMTVFELGAGSGYTTELLARAVGPAGRVIAHNSPYVLEHYVKDRFAKRQAKPVMRQVTHWIAPFDHPLPADAPALDLAVAVLVYHDTPSMAIDRGAMNRRIYEGLKPGGSYLVIDHAASPGSGISRAADLHRIEEQTVIDEVTGAGFTLSKRADFLRNPHDDRSRFFRDMNEPTDRFVLLFRKQPKTDSNL